MEQTCTAERLKASRAKRAGAGKPYSTPITMVMAKVERQSKSILLAEIGVKFEFG